MAELSEFTTMGCLHFTNNQLDKFTKSEMGMQDLASQIWELGETDVINWGSETGPGTEKQNMLIKLGGSNKGFEGANLVAQTNLAMGISGAKAIRKWLSSHHKKTNVKLTGKGTKKGYMTGGSWSTEIEHFKFDHLGMKDYNSSDIIVQLGRKEFYGISLKKKGMGESAQDPTILNKAFDTILNAKSSPAIKKLQADMELMRTKFFADVMRKAHKEKRIDLGPLKNATDLELFTAKVPKEQIKKYGGDKGGKPKRFINVKGALKPFKGTVFEKGGQAGYNDPGKPKGNNDFRAFVLDQLNPKTTGNKNIYKLLYDAISDKHANFFGETLVNLVLKKDLLTERGGLNSKQFDVINHMEDYKFGFALCTMAGAVTSNRSGYNVRVGNGICYEQASVMCAIAHFKGVKKTNKYSIKGPFLVRSYSKLTEAERKNQEENVAAAKIWFEIYLGKNYILDLELRYKGEYGSQPQFFGYITDDFKEVVNGICENIKD